MAFRTEFDFKLPQGYVDKNGQIHRDGIMRLATAADEILLLRDIRVRQNPDYLTVIILSRVILRLGDLKTIDTDVIENLSAPDLTYLQEFYRKLNESGSDPAEPGNEVNDGKRTPAGSTEGLESDVGKLFDQYG